MSSALSASSRYHSGSAISRSFAFRGLYDVSMYMRDGVHTQEGDSSIISVCIYAYMYIFLLYYAHILVGVCCDGSKV